MGTIIVILLLVIVILIAVKSTLKRIIHGSACCGERDAPGKKIKVSDKNKSHYPFNYTLSIDGMHCSNCIRRIENTLNKLEGIWATGNLEKKEVLVLSKKLYDKNIFEDSVSNAGYTVLNVTSKNFLKNKELSVE
jgi:copper chaperone CopZ